MSISAIVALGSLGLGTWQAYEGSQRAKNPRPQYQIPQASQESLANARILASLRELPSQDILSSKLGVNMAQTLKQIAETTTSPSSLTGALADLESRRSEAEQNIALQGDQFWVNNQAVLRDALNKYSGEQKAQNEWNLYQPYLNEQSAAANLKSAGTQNIFNSLTNFAQGYDTKQMYDKYFADKNTPTTAPIGVNTDTGKQSFQPEPLYGLGNNPYQEGYGYGGVPKFHSIYDFANTKETIDKLDPYLSNSFYSPQPDNFSRAGVNNLYFQ